MNILNIILALAPTWFAIGLYIFRPQLRPAFRLRTPLDAAVWGTVALVQGLVVVAVA